MPTDLHRDEVQKLRERGAQLVEVLPPKEYAQQHIAGALSIPLREMDAETTKALTRERPVITYCHDYQ